MAKRQKIRKLEAMRDDLMQKKAKAHVDLAKVRTELAHARKS